MPDEGDTLIMLVSFLVMPRHNIDVRLASAFGYEFSDCSDYIVQTPIAVEVFAWPAGMRRAHKKELISVTIEVFDGSHLLPARRYCAIFAKCGYFSV